VGTWPRAYYPTPRSSHALPPVIPLSNDKITEIKKNYVNRINSEKNPSTGSLWAAVDSGCAYLDVPDAAEAILRYAQGDDALDSLKTDAKPKRSVVGETALASADESFNDGHGRARVRGATAVLYSPVTTSGDAASEDNREAGANAGATASEPPLVCLLLRIDSLTTAAHVSELFFNTVNAVDCVVVLEDHASIHARAMVGLTFMQAKPGFLVNHMGQLYNWNSHVYVDPTNLFDDDEFQKYFSGPNVYETIIRGLEYAPEGLSASAQ
jgi:hypothetical protein